jgi:hypothetical protein
MKTHLQKNNCKNTICDAPPNIIKEVAKVSNGVNPNSIPIAPNIIPKGTTGINKGRTSMIPLVNKFNLLSI